MSLRQVAPVRGLAKREGTSSGGKAGRQRPSPIAGAAPWASARSICTSDATSAAASTARALNAVRRRASVWARSRIEGASPPPSLSANTPAQRRSAGSDGAESAIGQIASLVSPSAGREGGGDTTT